MKQNDLDRSRIGKRLAHIERQLAEVTEKLLWIAPAKRGLGFTECLPPKSVCCDAISKVDRAETYEGLLEFLSIYYQVPVMKMCWDKDKLWMDNSKAHMAEYSSLTHTAYTTKKGVDTNTVLHEFFHHLVANFVVIVKKKEEERYAKKFAEIILTRGEK